MWPMQKTWNIARSSVNKTLELLAHASLIVVLLLLRGAQTVHIRNTTISALQPPCHTNRHGVGRVLAHNLLCLFSHDQLSSFLQPTYFLKASVWCATYLPFNNTNKRSSRADFVRRNLVKVHLGKLTQLNQPHRATELQGRISPHRTHGWAWDAYYPAESAPHMQLHKANG